MIRALFLAAGIALAVSASTSAATTSRQAISSRRFLIGTWNCTFAVGAKSGAYTTAWTQDLNNLWLKQSIVQRATRNMMSADPASGGFRAEYFVGFDERRQAWVRFGAMSTGQYFAIRMTGVGAYAWAWKYVSFFPPRKRAARASSGAPDALFTRVSDTEYKIDGPTYPEGSTMVTEHHLCRKA